MLIPLLFPFGAMCYLGAPAWGSTTPPSGTESILEHFQRLNKQHSLIFSLFPSDEKFDARRVRRIPIQGTCYDIRHCPSQSERAKFISTLFHNADLIAMGSAVASIARHYYFSEFGIGLSEFKIESDLTNVRMLATPGRILLRHDYVLESIKGYHPSSDNYYVLSVSKGTTIMKGKPYMQAIRLGQTCECTRFKGYKYSDSGAMDMKKLARIYRLNGRSLKSCYRPPRGGDATVRFRCMLDIIFSWVAEEGLLSKLRLFFPGATVITVRTSANCELFEWNLASYKPCSPSKTAILFRISRTSYVNEVDAVETSAHSIFVGTEPVIGTFFSQETELGKLILFEPLGCEYLFYTFQGIMDFEHSLMVFCSRLKSLLNLKQKLLHKSMQTAISLARYGDYFGYDRLEMDPDDIAVVMSGAYLLQDSIIVINSQSNQPKTNHTSIFLYITKANNTVHYFDPREGNTG